MEAVMRTTAGAGRPHTRRPHTRRPHKTPARGVSTFPGDGLTSDAGNPSTTPIKDARKGRLYISRWWPHTIC